MTPRSIVSFAACMLCGVAVATGGCAAGDAPLTSDAGADDSAAAADTPSFSDSAPTLDAAARLDAAPAPDASHDAGLADQAAPDAARDAAPTTLDLHQVTVFNNPANLADWPVTTQITDVEFQYMGADGIHVEFSKRDGPGSWPDVTPPGWTGSLEYTVAIVENINGQWYTSAAIEFWRGLPSAGGNVASDTVTGMQCTSFGLGSSCQIAKNWYYDGRWGNLAGYQPATGETIGIFVVAGNLRGVTDGSQSPVQERSNIVLMPMPGFAGAKYTF